MLYPARSFSKDNEATITLVKFPEDKTFGIKTPGLGGRTETLSQGDLAGVNEMYKDKAIDVTSLMPIRMWRRSLWLKDSLTGSRTGLPAHRISATTTRRTGGLRVNQS